MSMGYDWIVFIALFGIELIYLVSIVSTGNVYLQNLGDRFCEKKGLGNMEQVFSSKYNKHIIKCEDSDKLFSVISSSGKTFSNLDSRVYDDKFIEIGNGEFAD